MQTDRMTAGVDRLDPESRALLELSVVRGLPDGELAGMLGIEEARLRERREAVMSQLGAESEEDREAVGAALRGEPEPAAEEGEAAADEPGTAPAAPAPARPPGPQPAAEPPPRRRAGAIAATGGIAVAVVVALAFALSSDDESQFSSSQSPDEPQAQRTGRLEAIGGAEAGGTARITGPEDEKVLRLTVQGLPRPARGGYVVWLYDSLSNARPLTGSRRGTFSVREPLPAGFARYSFLDVSREPADGNANHSGQSVLRVPLEQVPGA